MSKGKIHFENEPFMAIVSDKGDKPIKLTPVVYDEYYNCGVGIMYENRKGQVWGLLTPRNLIAAWRATEILRHLNTIENGTLAYAYYTGDRRANKSDIEKYVNPMIVKIGQDKYKKIMEMPVPEEIIRAILDNQKEKNAPDLYPIKDEVEAGTLEWRQEFADAGIERPEVIARVQAKARKKSRTWLKCIY